MARSVWQLRARIALAKAGRRKPLHLGDLSGGGWFQRFQEAIEEYGVLPRSAMPDSYDAKHEYVIGGLIRATLSAADRDLRASRNHAGRRHVIAKYRAEIDGLLDTAYGVVPTRVEFYGKSLTPKQVRDALQFDVRNYVYIQHDAKPSARPGTRFVEDESDFAGSLRSLLVSPGVLRKAVSNTIQSGKAVWFSSAFNTDVPYAVPTAGPLAAAFPKESRGLMGVARFGYHRVVPSARNLTVAQARRSGILHGSHAMAFTGQHLEADGKLQRLQIENSHGTHAGRDGYLDMDTDFFGRYVADAGVTREALLGALRSDGLPGELSRARVTLRTLHKSRRE
jgi:bleomycin hydrolase